MEVPYGREFWWQYFIFNTFFNSASWPQFLQLSPSVKNVTFAGNAVAAKKKMKLVADCSERNLKDVSKN